MELQQDALDEAFRRHKNYFQHFLENEVRTCARGFRCSSKRRRVTQ